MGMKRPSLLIIWLTVFLDLVGFGIVLPLLPIYSDRFGAGGFMIGVIVASYSIMQFIFSPLWGRWSDRIGRRPIILISTLGSTISYVIFAIGSGLGGATGLWILLISRIFAGIGGANITVAQAYIADITPKDERSKRMGLIGMAFGLGFVLGPAIGGASARFGDSTPGWVAATLCGMNFLLASIILVESRKPSATPPTHRPRWEQWKYCFFQQPDIGNLILVFFLTTFSFTCFEMTLGLLIIENLNLHADQAKQYAGYLFAYCGIIGAVIQGGMIGRLVKLLRERNLIVVSLFLFALSMVLVPLTHSLGFLLVALTLLTIGTSAIRPPLFGLISIRTPAVEQGSTLGVTQAAGSLARCVGPIFSGILFMIRPSIPYFACAAITAVAGILTMAKVPDSHSHRAHPESESTE